MKVPHVGARVRSLTRVFADPDGTGTYVLFSGAYELLSVGTEGRVEEHVRSQHGTLICVVVFPGQLRASMAPRTLEEVY